MTQKERQSGLAQVNNTELYYEVAGSGHALTLIHGMVLDRRSWDDQFDVFAQEYKVLRYDMRGWGDSAQEEADPPFSPRKDFLSLLEYLDINTTYLVGVSGGGALALDFALEYPDKVDGLILVSSGPSGYPLQITEDLKAVFQRYYGALRQNDIASAVEATVHLWTDGPRRRPEQVNAQVRARVTAMTTQHIQRYGDIFAHQKHMLPLEPSASKRLAEVKVPTLIIAGKEDLPQAFELADAMEQGIARAKKVIIPGVAHHLHMEIPDEFNRMVLDFLRER